MLSQGGGFATGSRSTGLCSEETAQEFHRGGPFKQGNIVDASGRGIVLVVQFFDWKPRQKQAPGPGGWRWLPAETAPAGVNSLAATIDSTAFAPEAGRSRAASATRDP